MQVTSTKVLKELIRANIKTIAVEHLGYIKTGIIPVGGIMEGLLSGQNIGDTIEENISILSNCIFIVALETISNDFNVYTTTKFVEELRKLAMNAGKTIFVATQKQ